MRLWSFIIVFLLNFSAKAGLVDFSAFYYSDSFKNGTNTSTYGRTFYDITIATQLSKSTFIGWDYVSTSATDSPSGTAETLSGTQMGLKFFYFFGRNQMWRLAVAYNLVASSNYSTTSADWKGKGTYADIGAAIPFSDNGSFTLRINYSSTTYVDEYIGVAYTPVTNSRVYIFFKCRNSVAVLADPKLLMGTMRLAA